MGNVILTGFMGTGKSVVGRLLAARLGYRFLDLDALIVEEAGMSINDIFASHGEPYFRQLESEAIGQLSAEDCLVVATGGGAIINPANRQRLHGLGLVVNLTAPVAVIQRRLLAENDRPLLNDDKSSEKIAGMLAEREVFYADADERIDTAEKSVEEIVEVIVSILGVERGAWKA
jgi:shikimate kinase